MHTTTSQPLSRTIVAASLAIVGTLASFGATASPAHAGSGYSARLIAPLAAPQAKILGEAQWKCEGDSCRGPADGSAPAAACARVAKTFGKLSAFTSARGEFSAEQLAKCNAKA